MSGFLCPFCNQMMSEEVNTTRERLFNFESSNLIGTPNAFMIAALCITIHKCPHCGKEAIRANGQMGYCKNVEVPIYPKNLAKQYPDYIPVAIRNDYSEAFSIINDSPKASATLARRCLQGMIHDYWNIHEKNLNAEITSLKDKIQPDLWESIDGLRKLGNIGAHMENDINMIVEIEPNEAQMLISLIELLMKEWYINRHQREELFGGIKQMVAEKETARGK